MFSARVASRFLRTPSAQKLFPRSVFAVGPLPRPAACLLSVQRPRLAASFSTSFRVLEKQGTVDEELIAKLQSEIAIESTKDNETDYPPSVKEYLENGPFKLIDKPGKEEVQMVREFGDETVRVEFSTADLTDLVSDNLHDEALGGDVGPADGRLGGDRENTGFAEGGIQEDEFDDRDSSFPARLTLTISKKGSPGALQVEAISQDGMIVIENVSYYQSAELATAESAEAERERRVCYTGPPFGNLDEDLQVLMERYLDERGINTALALFVPDYIEYKEQREYVTWLKNFMDFVQN